MLVVYYSRSGNTREIANQIHVLAGGDIVELQTVNPYPAEYRATTEQAKQELQSGYRPPLKTKISDITAYDVVFVGSPNWWGTFSMPVWTFLSEYNLFRQNGHSIHHPRGQCPWASPDGPGQAMPQVDCCWRGSPSGGTR